MTKTQITVGRTYLANVSGKRTTVRITNVSQYGGWDGLNTVTGRAVRVKTAGRLICQVGT